MSARSDRIADIIVKGYKQPLTQYEQAELDAYASESDENRKTVVEWQDKNLTLAKLQEYYQVRREADPTSFALSKVPKRVYFFKRLLVLFKRHRTG